MKKVLFIAFALCVGAIPAFAQTKHPSDMAAIDAALPTARLTPAQKAEVVSLRRQGEQFHNSGKHGSAESAFEKAKAILKIR